MAVGSDVARVWARRLPLRNPKAKAVMSGFANYVDEDGRCSASLATIASDTDQSEATVRRCRKWLEERCVITCHQQWIDESGHLNKEGRGRRAPDEIRFNFKLDIAALDARTAAEADAARAARSAAQKGAAVGGTQESDDDAEVTSGDDSPTSQVGVRGTCEVGSNPTCEVGPSAVDDSLALPDRQGLTLPDRQGIHYEGILESPPKPPLAEKLDPKEGFQGEDDDRSVDRWLTTFRSTYPIPSNRPDEVRALAASLSPSERDRCLRGAAGVRAVREQSVRIKRPVAVVDPAKFLRNAALWDEYAPHAPVPREAAPDPVFVAAGSPEWRARVVLALITDRPTPDARPVAYHGDGVMVARPLPLAGLVLADCPVDTAQWRIVERGTRQCAAWRERLYEALGIWVEPSNQPTGETERREILGKVHEAWPVKKIGLRVPCEWPPPKHAGESPSVSPGTLMTEDDERFVREGC
jgi:hypothetical protein